MNNEKLKELGNKVNNLSLEEKKQRNLYLRKLLTGEYNGPLTGYASIDKPWLKNYPESAITDDVPNCSLYEYLKMCIKDDPNCILIDFFGEKITSKELLEKIDKQEKIFLNSGIGKGDVVALALANQPEAVYCIYALNKIGAIPCNIDPRINEEDIERDIRMSGAKHYIGINDTYSKIKNISKRYPLDSISIVSPLNSAPKSLFPFQIIKGFLGIKDALHGNYVLNREHKYGTMKKTLISTTLNSSSSESFDNKDLAVIVHTGGTSGKHKGVHLSNKALNTTVDQHKYLIGNALPGDTLYNPMPAFMSYGMTTMHLCLCNKFHMYMMATSSPKTFGKELVQLKPNIIYGGPIHYQAGRKSKELKCGADLSNNKIAVSGGEKTNIEEEKKNNEFYGALGFQDEIFNGYGASEMCGVFSVKLGRKNSLGSVGYPLPKNNIMIIDDESKMEIPYGQGIIGEIFLTGESLMNGYDDEEESKAAISDGWFSSEDLGYMNEKGELFITGRKKRQFVSGVDKVYCPLVEEVIESLPMIEKCVVVGVDDEELRKVPYVFLILKDQFKNNNFEDIVREKIINLISEKINLSSLPKYFDFDSDIKYTSQGKIDFVSMENDAEIKVHGTNQLVHKKKK